MVFDDEAAGQRGAARLGQRTSVNIEDARAGAALEMFVMPMFCRLETRLAGWQNHRLNLLAFLQQFQRAVNRGDAQSFQFLNGFLVNFGHRQRPRRLGDDLQNRVALTRLTLPNGTFAFANLWVIVDNSRSLMIILSDLRGYGTRASFEAPEKVSDWNRVERAQHFERCVIMLPQNQRAVRDHDNQRHRDKFAIE